MNFNKKSLLNLDQTTHGMSGTPTWKSWQSMIRRCRGNNDKAKWYADRGIKVCYRWRSFENFLADMGERPEGMSLDRIDNDKGYQPDNCRWADRFTQAGNKRSNVTLNGKTQSLRKWADELGIQRQKLHKRLRSGWPIERALTAKMFHESKGRRKSNG